MSKQFAGKIAVVTGGSTGTYSLKADGLAHRWEMARIFTNTTKKDAAAKTWTFGEVATTTSPRTRPSTSTRTTKLETGLSAMNTICGAMTRTSQNA
jgi:hypothetical protein